VFCCWFVESDKFYPFFFWSLPLDAWWLRPLDLKESILYPFAPPLACPEGPAVVEGPLGLFTSSIISKVLCIGLLGLLLFPPNDAWVFYLAAPPSLFIILLFLVFNLAPIPDFKTWFLELVWLFCELFIKYCWYWALLPLPEYAFPCVFSGIYWCCCCTITGFMSAWYGFGFI